MVSQTTGVPERFSGAPPGTKGDPVVDNKVPHYFLKVFGRPEAQQRLRVRARHEPAGGTGVAPDERARGPGN